MEDLLLQLAKQYKDRYYGKYRGFVTENNDPDQRCRVRVRVPSVLGDSNTDWALPSSPFGGSSDQGLFLVPEVGAQVWVEFEEGHLDHPIWTGAFWQKSGDPPKEAAKSPPTTRVLKTPSGHVLQFDDDSGKEKFRLAHPAGTEFSIDEKGTVVLVDAKKNSVTLDADKGSITLDDANGNSVIMSSRGIVIEDSNGNKIEMTAAGVTVKGNKLLLDVQQVMLAGSGGEPIIKGQSFLTLFATHVHPSAMGPTGPPVPQGETTTLSMKAMTG
jgi:uncharacterized protein involved in type VI secretion and phage assembly